MTFLVRKTNPGEIKSQKVSGFSFRRVWSKFSGSKIDSQSLSSSSEVIQTTARDVIGKYLLEVAGSNAAGRELNDTKYKTNLLQMNDVTLVGQD